MNQTLRWDDLAKMGRHREVAAAFYARSHGGGSDVVVAIEKGRLYRRGRLRMSLSEFSLFASGKFRERRLMGMTRGRRNNRDRRAILALHAAAFRRRLMKSHKLFVRTRVAAPTFTVSISPVATRTYRVLRLNPMNLHASGTRMVIGATVGRSASSVDRGDITPPAYYSRNENGRAARARRATPNYP